MKLVRVFLFGVIVGMSVVMMIPQDSHTINKDRIEATVMPDTVILVKVKKDTSTADSLRSVISNIQKELNSVSSLHNGVKEDSFLVIQKPDTQSTYIQYRSIKTIKAKYIEVKITAYSLTPVDSFTYKVNVDFDAYCEEKNPKYFGISKDTYIGMAIGGAVIAILSILK